MSASSPATPLASKPTTPPKNATPSAPASASTPASRNATAACPKARATKAATKPTAHPSWREIIKECIATSDAPTRQGVSRNAIKKARRVRRQASPFAADKYKLNTPAHVSQLNRAIIVGVDGGFFVQPKGPSGCVKLASKVRSQSKENSKPVSKASASEPQAKTAKLNAQTASKPAANAKAVTTKTTAKTTKDAPAKKPLAGKSKAPKNDPSIAANAKKAVVGKKAAPAAMAKAAPAAMAKAAPAAMAKAAALKNAVPRAAPHMSAA
ncbi:histone H1 [Mycena olivaceomarginata]|nr:histone H1 [Mycena olivaceomarginata]